MCIRDSRNRTSPFAFTGNKFEFRMVGSKDSISACNVVLNTITAEAFKEACDVLESAEDFDLAVHDLIKEYATQHQRIVFNGNGYAPEWEKEARRRGLPVPVSYTHLFVNLLRQTVLHDGIIEYITSE